MDKYNNGDTWEFVDQETGNRGAVWMQEKDSVGRGSRFYFPVWYMAVEYSDGSHPDGHFDWFTTKAAAVEMAKQKLAGMGSNEHKMRFKFNPNIKFGESQN